VEQAALETSVLITNSSHLRRLRRGEIDMRIGTVEKLCPGKAVLNDGTEEDVDFIVMATGWSLGFDLIMDNDLGILSGLNFKGGLDFCQDGLWLYRNILPVGFKGMAFVGSNTLTFMNIYTSYIQAYWLAGLLAGERPWPDAKHMKETVEREKKFKRRLYRASDMRGASVEAYMQHYHDILFREMNARQPFNCIIRPIANLVWPVVPATMKDCLEPLPAIKKYNTVLKEKEKTQKAADALSEKTSSVVFENESSNVELTTNSPVSNSTIGQTSAHRIDMSGQHHTSSSDSSNGSADSPKEDG
jgi:hypothetical protein